MKSFRFFDQIIGITKPWKVSSVEFDGVDTVNVVLDYDRSMRPPAPYCPDCGGDCTYYDMVDKTWRHTDMCDQICMIHGQVPRVRCKSCGGTFRVAVPWASESISKYTDSFESKVVNLVKEMPVSSVCREMRLDDSTVWTIVSRYVNRCMGDQDLSHVHTYYVDEKAIRKGHVYLSTFMDQDRNVIFVGKDNSAQTIRDFRDHLESHNGSADDIRHISEDMSVAYSAGAAECFPNARVTYDKFHVVSHLTEAVNDVRKREYDQFGPKDNPLKGQRYLFLKNYNNLDDDGQEKVRGLLTSFPDLGKAYVLKESFGAVWEMGNRYDAYMFAQRWLEEAENTGIAEILKVAAMIRSHLDGILNWYESRINNGVMEGFNSVLQAFKGRARGYRSFERYRTMIYLRSSNLC